jgi:hypothetical protein
MVVEWLLSIIDTHVQWWVNNKSATHLIDGSLAVGQTSARLSIGWAMATLSL